MDKSDKNKENNESFDDVSFVESTEDGDVLPKKDVIKKLKEEIKNLKKEKEEYLTGWQRSKADSINLQKDLDTVRKSSALLAKEIVVNDILPAIDSFDVAFSNKEAWEKVDKNWRVGVEYIHQKLLSALGDNGVTKIGEEGELFDPNLHESVGLIETDKEDNEHKIAKIIQAGYKMGEKVIRPAKVSVYSYKK